MVAEALGRRPRSVRCRAEHEAAYSFNRYRCRQGERRFVVRWQQYGSGQYSVAEVTADGPRVIARGIASFGG